MNAALPRIVVHGCQKVQHLKKPNLVKKCQNFYILFNKQYLQEAVGLHEPRHKTVGLGPQGNLEAVEAPRPLPVFLEFAQI